MKSPPWPLLCSLGAPMAHPRACSGNRARACAYNERAPVRDKMSPGGLLMGSQGASLRAYVCAWGTCRRAWGRARAGQPLACVCADLFFCPLAGLSQGSCGRQVRACACACVHAIPHVGLGACVRPRHAPACAPACRTRVMRTRDGPNFFVRKLLIFLGFVN